MFIFCAVSYLRFVLSVKENWYRVFQRFRQAKFDNGGSTLSLSQFLLLPRLPQKMKLASKVVKSTQNNWLTDNDINP
jgi:hypothetical protein